MFFVFPDNSVFEPNDAGSVLAKLFVVCYLNDGANVYIGPTTSFIAASAEELTDEATRSRMAAEGVAAIAKEIERQKRRRINGRDV